MPLSEQEQRLLEEMERSLYSSDSDFVATSGGAAGRPNYTVTVLGVLGALLGVGVVVAGVVTRVPLLGVAGFVVVLAGVLFAIAPPRSKKAAAAASAPGRPGSAPRSSTSRPSRQRAGLMDRLNERWERRQDGDDRR